MEYTTAFSVYLILLGQRCIKDKVSPEEANKRLRSDEEDTLERMQKYGTFELQDVRRCFARALYIR